MASAMTNFAPASALSSLVADAADGQRMARVCPTCGMHYPAEFKVCPRDATELADIGDQDSDPILGTTLGQTYSIIRVIGEGGMGRVYEARHTRIGSKRFAIKMLHPEFARQAEVISRFQREAEAAAAIQSPYVVGVFDVDRTADGRPYMVGELLDGKEFGDYLADHGRMPVGLAVRIVRQICQALAAAHDKGVVHRDMKPENVFLTGDLSSPTAKVIDFGISKIGDAPGTALTKTGMIMGTPAYMAPEQARGEKVDHRADIYSVGAILYCALTGQRPFDRGDPTATLMAVLTEDPPRPRSLEPSIPEPLEVIIQRAMAKIPSDRYQSMAELDADLAAYDTAGTELIIPMPSSGGGGLGAPAATITSRRASAALDRQTRVIAMARPLIVLLAALGLFWVAGSVLTTITAIVRYVKGPGKNLESTEAVLLIAGLLFAIATPVALAVRHVKKNVWGNSVKVLALSERLRTPVVVGLGAYGFASLLVRLIETVLLRKAVAIAWPGWDLILVLIGVVSAFVASRVGDAERG